MNYEELKKDWLREENHAFQGWDFSRLKSRWRGEPLEWDYKLIVMERLRPSDKLLDMGTGGGEFLLSLNHPHENTSVTESWRPNIELCRKKLAPLGVRVYPTREGSPLPIPDDAFDVVINRQESYDLREVRRVLKTGGTFVTQQVGGQNCADLERRINVEPPVRQEYSLETELPGFRECGFEIQYVNENFPQLKFFDVGAIVYWAKIIEWSFPNFSVENNFDRLLPVQEEMEKNGFVADLEHRFMIVAKNGK